MNPAYTQSPQAPRGAVQRGLQPALCSEGRAAV